MRSFKDFGLWHGGTKVVVRSHEQDHCSTGVSGQLWAAHCPGSAKFNEQDLCRAGGLSSFRQHHGLVDSKVSADCMKRLHTANTIAGQSGAGASSSTFMRDHSRRARMGQPTALRVSMTCLPCCRLTLQSTQSNIRI